MHFAASPRDRRDAMGVAEGAPGQLSLNELPAILAC
jgi:hypothetical protein